MLVDASLVGPSAPAAITLQATSGTVVVPGGPWMLNADFARDGSNLVLTGADGKQIIVQGYFATETPPDLRTDSGALLQGDLVVKLAGPIAPGQYAQAGSVDASPAEPIGRVDTAEGTVEATRVDGTQVTLSKGDPVFQGDTLVTGANGVVGIIFADETTFSLAASGRMVLDEMVYDPGAQTGSFKMSVVQGVFSFVSGQVAKTSPDGMVLTTPVANIGIRGTTGAGRAAAEGSGNDFTLLPDPNGQVGEITITTGAGVVVLSTAGATTTVSSFFTPPAPIRVMSQTEINSAYGTAVNTLPNRPATTQGDQAQAQGQQGPQPGNQQGPAGEGNQPPGEGGPPAGGDGPPPGDPLAPPPGVLLGPPPQNLLPPPGPPPEVIGQPPQLPPPVPQFTGPPPAEKKDPVVLPQQTTSTETTTSTDALAQSLAAAVGGLAGLNITSATYFGGSASASTYSSVSLGSLGGTTYALSGGVLFTSGSATTALSSVGGQSLSSASGGSLPSGNAVAALIASNFSVTSTDATALSFTFTLDTAAQKVVSSVAYDPTAIIFDWMFGSEEFPSQSVTDLAAVFVNGANALTFDQGEPVRFVLSTPSPTFQYFADNTSGTLPIGFSGITSPRSFAAPLAGSLGTAQTVQIVVTDTNDVILDSGLFLSTQAYAYGPAAATSGNDLLAGTAGTENFFATAGNDVVFTLGGNDVLRFDLSDDIVSVVQSGTNLVFAFKDGMDPTTYTTTIVNHTVPGQGLGQMEIGFGLITEALQTFDVAATLTGVGFVNDTAFAGTAQTDVIFGGMGNDILLGNGGDDFLFGGDGEDFLIGGEGNNSLDGGTGTDTVSYFSASNGVMVDLTDMTSGGTGTGSHGFDGMIFAFDDALVDIENIEGSKFADLLIGDNASNTIVGGDGFDTIHGGQGTDLLKGGGGNDTFIFGSADSGLGSGNRDAILDFNAGSNATVIDEIVFESNFMTVQFIGASAFSTGSGTLQVRFDDTGKILQADTDDNGSADLEIELNGVSIGDLANNDFDVIPVPP